MSGKVIEFPRPFSASGTLHSRIGPLSIVSVGRDPAILQFREQSIRNRSNVSILSMDPEEAESWTRLSDARLWIFCSTIELPKVVHLACSVRRYSARSKLLLLEGTRHVGFERSLFNRVVSPAETMQSFLDMVTFLSLAS